MLWKLRTLLAVFILASCATTEDVQYRTFRASHEECAETLHLKALNTETKNTAGANCALQRHALPQANLSGRSSWAEIAPEAEGDQVPLEPENYHLAFVEISDNGALHADWQLDQLVAHLKAQKRGNRRNYVVTYVHGWRHDAKIGDNDIRKFRVILGYARAALNTRCHEAGDYCDTTLTGVYVGWRGRAFDEDSSQGDADPRSWASVGAAPTIFNRKIKSDELGASDGEALARVLDKLQATLRPNPDSRTADRFLIFGHSLGGNMLATLMQPRVEQALHRHPVWSGKTMKPPLGDLVVLLNPASEAMKWTENQMRARRRNGFRDSDNYIIHQPGNAAQKADLDRLWNYYPQRQRPVFIALTATADWSRNETFDRKVNYDKATRHLFPLAGIVLADDPSQEVQTTAIGHLMPGYEDRTHLKGAAIGASHEFTVVRGIGRRTNYANANHPDRAWCASARGWLYHLRDLQGQANTADMGRGALGNTGWDFGMVRDPSDGGLVGGHNVAPGRNGASYQMRQALYLSRQSNLMSVEPGNSPFWNMRAFDTALRGHGGYVNYPTWCAIHQLVLDDVGASTRPSAMVQQMLQQMQPVPPDSP